MEGSGNTTDSSITTSTTSTPSTCNNPNETLWIDGTCIPKEQARNQSVTIARDNSTSLNEKVDALIVYFGLSIGLTTEPNISNILTPREIDKIIDDLTDKQNATIRRESNSSVIMAFPVADGNIGGLLKNGQTSDIITNITKASILESNISAAAIISDKSVHNINSIAIFILSNPEGYKNLDSSNNQSVASPVIIFSVKANNGSLIHITLYFQVLKTNDSRSNGRYSCSFFNTSISKWDEFGCSKPQYIQKYDRYECTCNHLTTFALLWLPSNTPSNYLTSQDIASLIFLSISILSFITIIIHSLTIRFCNTMMSFRARDLLPLISSASTTVLFIFFIALTLTVYIRTKSENETKCFLSSSVLMFFVYFFLIFMFCTKTSVGYFNYLRFVHLFPEPSYRKLFILLIISFIISILLTSFAAGFNSNSSYNITQIHQNKICWFTRDVIYYFLTIPVCIFLLLNFLTIILVTRRIITHARNATSRHHSYERMKRCVIVLLSSCITQGIGWLFGPFILFRNRTAEDILGWIFIIFNGLEGVWSILLYIIIRSQRIDEPRCITNRRQRRKKNSLKSMERKKKRKISDLNDALLRRLRVTHRNAQQEKIGFNHFYNQRNADLEINTSEV